MRLAIFVAATLVMASCGSTKDVAYFQNSDRVILGNTEAMFDARIMPKDVLTITVSTTDPEASAPFNLVVGSLINGDRLQTQMATLQNYIVDNNGNIEYPKVGSVHLGGLTKAQAEQTILSRIMPYMNPNEKPIVAVRMVNYKVSVLGEVARPGMYTVANEKITVLEALALAGDLTIYGVRTNVKLVREASDGKKTMHTLDLTDAAVVTSPYFYLQQNDVIYVEPNKVKSQNSTVGQTTSLWFSATSILISMASLLYNILK